MTNIQLALQKYQRVLLSKKHILRVHTTTDHPQQRWLGQIDNISAQFSSQSLDYKSVKETTTLRVRV